MIGVALKGLAGRKVRALLTAFAIVIGVSMVSGTFILTDTMQKSFNGLFDASYDEDRRRHPGQGDRQELHQRQRRHHPRIAPRQGPGAARGRGRRRHRVAAGGQRRRHHRQGRQGRRAGEHRHQLRRRQRALQPAQAQDRRLAAGRRAGRDRRRHGEEGALQASATRSSIDTADGKHTYEITGTASYGDVDSLGFGSIAVWDLETAQQVLDREGRYDGISIAAKPGTSTTELVKAVQPLVPDNVCRSRTAPSRREDDAEQLNDGMGKIRTFLLGFGGIALLVGAFVIFNTLSITVAQRTREFATLRTLGASRKQVMRSVQARGPRDRPARLGDRARRRARDREGHDRAVQRARRRPPRGVDGRRSRGP